VAAGNPAQVREMHENRRWIGIRMCQVCSLEEMTVARLTVNSAISAKYKPTIIQFVSKGGYNHA
jgi:hypothetical protein